MTDGLTDLNKCLKCGYSKRTVHIASFTEKFLYKKGYYELYQPLDEHLYNILRETGKDERTAKLEVKRDLGLTDEKADYFDRKVTGENEV
jgi:hypothetical protein